MQQQVELNIEVYHTLYPKMCSLNINDLQKIPYVYTCTCICPLHVSNDRADNCLNSRIIRSVNSFGYFIITLYLKT